MKKLLAIAILILAAWVALDATPVAPRAAQEPPLRQQAVTAPADALAAAWEAGRSNVQVEGEGTVARILPDDDRGSRHQKFLVRLASGQTVLVAHNIDLAPRVASLAEGDRVRFYGEYEWNDRGGVVHWTHDDPDGRHAGGWIEHRGRTYR